MTAHDTSPQTRSERSLSGSWSFRLDPDDVGIDERWYQTSPWSDADRVSVPHAWQEDPDRREYTGTAWYRRTVDLGESDLDGIRPHIAFDAVDYDAIVWVNGERLGTHRGGYLSFRMDATDALSLSENEVVVRVEDPANLDEIPHGKQGDPWYTRVSGIWGDVRLELLPETFVEAARVTPNLTDDTAHVALSIDGLERVGSTGLSAEIRIERDDEVLARTSVAVDGGDRTGGDGGADVVLALDEPDYWSPDSPVLYDLTVVLRREDEVIDEYHDYFGMRSIDIEDGELRLNGEPLFVRGALDQGYYPETLYRPNEPDAVEREVRTAKELGFNLLRKHIKPARPEFVEAADRLGLLLWEEPANPTRDTTASREAVEREIEALVARDYNRPSVVVWSLYNEEWGLGHHEDETSLWHDPDKQSFLADLYERTKARDPTRLVCDNSGWAHVATDVNDYHEYVVSPDRADVWCDRLDSVADAPEENYAATETDPDKAPIVVSEFGTWGMPDWTALEAQYGGRPSWYDHDFLADYDFEGEKLKRPAGIAERFEMSHASTVFEDDAELARAWQTRAHRSNADLVGELRARTALSGYVITEFTDVEWEGNGVLDYFREPKAFHDEFAAINAPVALHLTPERHAVWAGNDIDVTATVSNHTSEPLDGTVEWEAFGAAGRLDISIPAHDTVRLDAAFTVLTDDVEAVTTAAVTASFEATDWEVPGSAPLTIVPPGDRRSADDTLVVHLGAGSQAAGLGDAFTESDRYDLTANPGKADVVIVTRLNEQIDQVVDSGGRVVLLPNEDGEVDSNADHDFHDLPPGESWHLVAGLFYHDAPLLDGLTEDEVLGWGFEGLYPYAVVRDADPTVDDIVVGYAEGWMANRGSPLFTRAVGAGSVTTCTFRITDQYGDHPVATVLLDRLLADVAER